MTTRGRDAAQKEGRMVALPGRAWYKYTYTCSKLVECSSSHPSHCAPPSHPRYLGHPPSRARYLGRGRTRPRLLRGKTYYIHASMHAGVHYIIHASIASYMHASITSSIARVS